MAGMRSKDVVLMEQVAMYMAALPCPPMPLIVKQELSDDEEKQCYKNSHDLIATLLLGAMGNGDTVLNAQRKEKQIELTEKLLQRIRAANGDAQSAYTAFSEFTAGYICAFINIDVSVSFMPMHHVVPNDCVHRACCSWHKAQEVILMRTAGAGDKAKAVDAILASDVSHHAYPALLLLHCKRFGAEEDHGGSRGSLAT
jgi:hypothetical protein